MFASFPPIYWNRNHAICKPSSININYQDLKTHSLHHSLFAIAIAHVVDQGLIYALLAKEFKQREKIHVHMQ